MEVAVVEDAGAVVEEDVVVGDSQYKGNLRFPLSTPPLN